MVEGMGVLERYCKEEGIEIDWLLYLVAEFGGDIRVEWDFDEVRLFISRKDGENMMVYQAWYEEPAKPKCGSMKYRRDHSSILPFMRGELFPRGWYKQCK